MATKGETPQPSQKDLDAFDQIAQWGDAAGLDLNPKPKEPNKLVDAVLIDRPLFSPPIVLAELKARMDFKESHKWWQVGEDVIGLRRRLVGGQHETYMDKLGREKIKGKTEAASLGIGSIGGGEVVLFGMHYDFFAGSLGVVAGEKFQQASDIAISKDVPLISVYSSGGARQQEATPGLRQMERMVNAIRNFRKTGKINIGVLNGQVWGGISASAVPLGDIIVALEGTDFGFSGPRVIEKYAGTAVGQGEQSAEMHSRMHRNIDRTVKDPDELYEFLDATLRLFHTSKTRLTSENLPDFKIATDPLARHAIVSEEKSIPLFEGEEKIIPSKPLAERLFEQYQRSSFDLERVDSQTLTEEVFSDVVRLYDSYTLEGSTHYPAIIASIGRIGPQPFLIIGNQPTYTQLGKNFYRTPSSPEPKDFKYMQRMLQMGGRLGLPVVFLTDTLGAKPTLKSEQEGQSATIAESLLENIDYPNPVISVVIGALGSGGGLATTPTGDYCAMLSEAMAFVAEPGSQASILYNKPNPSIDEVKETLLGAKSTAQEQLELGLIDQVILEGADQVTTSKNVYLAIAMAFIELSAMSSKKLHERRNKRIRGIVGIPIKKRK